MSPKNNEKILPRRNSLRLFFVAIIAFCCGAAVMHYLGYFYRTKFLEMAWFRAGQLTFLVPIEKNLEMERYDETLRITSFAIDEAVSGLVKDHDKLPRDLQLSLNDLLLKLARDSKDLVNTTNLNDQVAQRRQMRYDNLAQILRDKHSPGDDQHVIKKNNH